MEETRKTVNVSELLADYISEQNYGTIIRYQDIEEITKTRRGTKRYWSTVNKTKNMLLSTGKAIKAIWGSGDYQVIYPGDYSGEYAREVRIARGHVKRGEKILRGAPVNDMTAEERRVYNDVTDFHVRLQAQINGNYVEVRRLTGKRPHPFAITNGE